ncbi:MAG TPA: hypothetical protein DCS93_12855 [Microscillaceae bacterium]|nr:hypothetical protein [Microscillaceae bacterium]
MTLGKHQNFHTMKRYYKYLIILGLCLHFAHAFAQDSTSSQSEKQIVDSLLKKYVKLYQLALTTDNQARVDYETFILEDEIKKYPLGRQQIAQKDSALKKITPRIYAKLEAKRKAYQASQDFSEEETKDQLEDKKREIEELKKQLQERQATLKAKNRFRIILLLSLLILAGALVFIIRKRRYNQHNQ